MKLLITGGLGFLGSNLACEAQDRGLEPCVFDNLSRIGAAANLAWLERRGRLEFVHGDIRNPADVRRAVSRLRPDGVFHLAAQVAMTTSLREPRRDFETNALGTLNLLEAVRELTPEAAIIYSSTNKVYGDLEWLNYEREGQRWVMPDYPDGLPETIPLDFQSPYGCSKGAADQYVLDYARCFGLRTAVFRHSSIYGQRQFASFDQGWIGWFCTQALATQKDPRHCFTINGDGYQVRDALQAGDAAALYFNALRNIDQIVGLPFNVGGGIANSLSLRELFDHLEQLLEVRLSFETLAQREGDQRVFIADTTQLQKKLGWSPQISMQDGLAAMLDWTGTLTR